MDIAYAHDQRIPLSWSHPYQMLREECRNEERDRRLHPQHAHYFFIFFLYFRLTLPWAAAFRNDITIPVLASSVMTSGILPNDLADSRNGFQVGPSSFHVISLKAQKKKKNLSRENNSI